MRTLKPIFGVVGALVPVLYCGGLLYYFFGVGGSVQGAEAIGLGPTLIGLAAVGLMFCIPLIVKFMRIFNAPRSPGSGGGPDATGDDDREAEAAIARYMARQSVQTAPSAPAARPAQQGGGPARGFGRKIR